MANYNDQARAIWSALDTMLQQDPEGYKRFVSEQLEEGRKMIKKQQAQSPTSNQKGHPDEKLEKAFGKISLDSGKSGDGQKRGLMTSAPSSAKNKSNKEEKMTRNKGGLDKDTEDNVSPKLLDDEIGGSILEQIVKNADREGKESDEDDVKLTTLEIDSVAGSKGSRPPQKLKKPLIEEI